jgi:nucleoside-diphosphate-sugar epimerase
METAAPTPSPTSRNALVFGATGFIGRWLVKELLQQGVPTNAAVRDIGRSRSLTDWLDGQDADTSLLRFIEVDLSRDGLGVDGGALWHVSEVYNVAGAYAFGMTADAARAANVDTSRRVVEFASTLPALMRLVHLSGYRVGGQDAASVPWPVAKRKDLYSRLGAYEASKVESDAVVQATAQKLGVPLTVANPATVIGDSVTGESHQILGLATTIRDLVRGKLMAVPGNSATFVPVVTVDYLARFMTLLPTVDATLGQSYWILDDDTPSLPDLVKLIANYHGLRVPRMRIPVGLVKRLPAAITRADPETLSFLSTDRYPTGPATALAHSHGLSLPDVRAALTVWSSYLIANDFAEAPRSAVGVSPA